jgi:hypothetical protein
MAVKRRTLVLQPRLVDGNQLCDLGHIIKNPLFYSYSEDMAYSHSGVDNCDLKVASMLLLSHFTPHHAAF